MLALFIMPILEILHASRLRALKYTQDRELRDLAQRKLFDVIYYVELERAGTFEVEGRPDWTWEVYEPEIVSQGAQVVLQYTIRVMTPQAEAAGITGITGGAGDLGEAGDGRPAFEMSAWTFPSPEWHEEQEYLQSMGYDTSLYGGMGLGGLPGGSYGR